MQVRSNSFPVLTQDTLWKYGGAPGTPVTLCGQFNYGCGYDSWCVGESCAIWVRLVVGPFRV